MKIGDEILLKAKVVDLDSNLHGVAVKFKVQGFVDRETMIIPFDKSVEFWIHRLNQAEVIVPK